MCDMRLIDDDDDGVRHHFGLRAHRRATCMLLLIKTHMAISAVTLALNQQQHENI